VAGSIVFLIGVALVLGGVALILAYATGRDSDGYYGTDSERLATPTYALTAENIDLGPTTTDVIPKDLLGHIRIRASRPAGRRVFVGIGPRSDVEAYLRGVAHAKLDDLNPPRYRTTPGGAPRQPPAAERFWVASAQGPGRQTLTWKVKADTGRSWP
jgi:hypothetical protein